MRLPEKVLAQSKQNRLFSSGETVLVACSGGADSVCLLHVLCGLREALGIRIAAVHVHHGIRGKSADRDALHVEECCKALGVPFVLKRVDVPAHAEACRLSLEEAARELRYQALAEAKEETGAAKIALAHHVDDQAETVLFRMVRGSGLRGLAGMRPVRDSFVRPLLGVSRDEIRAWLVENGISWCEDETNAEDDADRNRIRHSVMPALEALRPGAAQRIAEEAKLFGEADDFMRQEAVRFLEEHCRISADGILIPREDFLAIHPALQAYVVLESLERCGCTMRDKGRAHVEQIVRLFDSAPGSGISLPRDGHAERTREGVAVTPEAPAAADAEKGRKKGSEKSSGKESLEGSEKDFGKESFVLLTRDGLTAECPGIRMETRVFPMEKGLEIPQKEYTKWFDHDKMNRAVALRGRQSGDRFSTLPGTDKKLKDWMIDEKIPRELRDRIPLVADGPEVIWVVGRRMSENHKITENTRNVLEIRIILEGENNEPRQDQCHDL